MWIQATSEDQLKPGVKFRYWVDGFNGYRLFAYGGTFVESDTGLRRFEMQEHGAYDGTPIGNVTDLDFRSSYKQYEIWQEEPTDLISKVLTLVVREYYQNNFCYGGVEGFIDEVILPAMLDRLDTESIKANIVHWVKATHGLANYLPHLRELGIVVKKPKVTFKIDSESTFVLNKREFIKLLEDEFGTENQYIVEVSTNE